MNKIIPFNKNINFNSPIGEITSIALDDTLKFSDNYTIKGDLIVRGCHKYNDLEEDFTYPLPTQIAVDEKYDTSKAKISIDDFYYEIINDDTLKVKIDLILDDLYYKKEEIKTEEREVKAPDDLEINDIEEIMEEKTEDKKEIKNNEDDKKENNITNLFQETTDEKEYSIYRVYVITESDTLDGILDKYKVTKEELGYYNDLSNIKPGLKLIIPSVDE